MKHDLKTIENRVRRLADQRGYAVRKSRRRNIRPEDKGEFALFDCSTNLPVFGGHYDATLEEIEAWLTVPDEPEAAPRHY